ncbi:hypothetical protein FPZ44_23780 [Paenibacillus agilis]|uniref:Uncharacterized protein n=2 Tax=Paenibacillus agilis TaxID=3020863 RepID=A0A559IEN1_9BACL|nr:hypothetical protein FPZ44_23780 [Paenibacillus agilis]
MQNKPYLETLHSMKATYESQIQKLKEDKKVGLVCDKQYNAQLSIWKKRIKQYERTIIYESMLC